MNYQRQKTIKVPIYPLYFTLIVTKDVEKSVKAQQKNFPNYDTSFGEGNQGCAVMHNGHVAIFLDEKWICHGLIAHELSHIITMIEDHLQLRPEKENDEASAYLTDYLTEEVYKMLNHWKIKVKLVQVTPKLI